MKILVISSQYPYEKNNNFVFVKQLIDEFVEFNHEVTVISPKSMTSKLINKDLKYPYKQQYYTENSKYNVFFPKIISFSNWPILRNINSFLYNKSILRTIKKNNLAFDVIYAHFLMPSGISAYKISKIYNKPYFIAFGESTFNFTKNSSKKMISKVFENVDGIISVSTEIKERLLKLDYKIASDRIEVFPNGFNPFKFYPMNKNELREKYNMNKDDFIISFVGWFSNRKGIERLDQALKELSIENIKVIYIGEGEIVPDYKGIIYKGTVKNELLNEYLNISDVFVLPTLNEGSCNAIIEAMGAGLPIISSNKNFNDDILDGNAIRINSESIDEIKKAILDLYKDKSKQIKLSKESIKMREKFILKDRADNIIKFVDKRRKMNE